MTNFVGEILEVGVDEVLIWTPHISSTAEAVLPYVYLPSWVRDLIDLLHGGST